MWSCVGFVRRGRRVGEGGGGGRSYIVRDYEGEGEHFDCVMNVS